MTKLQQAIKACNEAFRGKPVEILDPVSTPISTWMVESLAHHAEERGRKDISEQLLACVRCPDCGYRYEFRDIKECPKCLAIDKVDLAEPSEEDLAVQAVEQNNDRINCK
ncbi:MAG: hypothetical protein KGL39_40970 [Patescibacteria group bacterium]|nr:hypothetical protein [Patescibacteria group bacterium]